LSRAQLYILILALLIIAFVAAGEITGAPVESLPMAPEFHPAYILQPDVAASITLQTLGIADDLPPYPPVEPMPPDDPVVLGYELPFFQGDFESIKNGYQWRKAAVRKIKYVVPQKPRIALISPQPSEEWIEGAPVTLRWLSSEPITKVRIYYQYDRCQMAGRSRGKFGALIAPMMPNQNHFRWDKVPWIDSYSFRIRIAGYDNEDNLLASNEIGVRFRPREFTNISKTCVAVLKRKQRLYYYVDSVIKRMHIVSTARAPFYTPPMRPGARDRRRGAMGKVFSKAPRPYSRAYQCYMPYWMAVTSSGSHGIHATSSPFYSRLGRPASHGCIRQHRADARILYNMVPLGTPVYVF